MARTRFERTLQLVPGHPEYLWNLAVTLRALGRADEGLALIAHFPKNLALSPNMVVPADAQGVPS